MQITGRQFELIQYGKKMLFSWRSDEEPVIFTYERASTLFWNTAGNGKHMTDHCVHVAFYAIMNEFCPYRLSLGSRVFNTELLREIWSQHSCKGWLIGRHYDLISNSLFLSNLSDATLFRLALGGT